MLNKVESFVIGEVEGDQTVMQAVMQAVNQAITIDLFIMWAILFIMWAILSGRDTMRSFLLYDPN